MTDTISEKTELDVVGLISILVFYLIVFVAGIWASKKKGVLNPQTSDDLLLAGRHIGLVVGIFTLSATQVGGAFLTGTSEEVFKRGLVWCMVPFAYSIGMSINGLLFAKTMRNRGYVTVFDPLQESYGRIMGGLCFVPHLIGDLFWVGAILSVLGSTLVVVVGLDRVTSILVSAAVAIGYTLVGGMFSVAYTDILQLILVALGMFISIPFILTSSAVKDGGYGEAKDWLGSVPLNEAGSYVDALLVPLLGGIPWQCYYQRVLSLKSSKQVLPMSLIATCCSLLMLIPPILIGGVAKHAVWNETALGVALTEDDAPMVLPLALRYLVPRTVTFFGLGAVSAAVVSSMDSAVLGASAALARNVYQQILRPQASDREIIWCTRIGVLLVGVAATGVAFTAESIYGLWYLSADLVFLIVFPHFLFSVWYPDLCNVYGSVASFVAGIVLRILVGEPQLNIPAVLRFPGYKEDEGVQSYPVRTICMIITSVILVIVSIIANKCQNKRLRNLEKSGKVSSSDQEDDTEECCPSERNFLLGLSFCSLPATTLKRFRSMKRAKKKLSEEHSGKYESYEMNNGAIVAELDRYTLATKTKSAEFC